MFLRIPTQKFTGACWDKIERLGEALDKAG